VNAAGEPCIGSLPLFFSSGSRCLDVGLRHESGRDAGDGDGWDAFLHVLRRPVSGSQSKQRIRSSGSSRSMSPSSPISKPPSLPSLSSSHIAHSYSVRTHDVFTAPSNSRAVITEPRACTTSSVAWWYSFSPVAAWAQDEPPSPTDQPDETDRAGHRSIVTTRPSDLASSSRSSFERLTRESDNRSRWWTFARPRQGSIRYGWRGLDTMNHSLPPPDDRQSQYLVNSRERRSGESPVSH